MTNPKIKLTSLCLGILSLSACGKLDDMHDATMKMNQTTSQMNQTTTQMSSNMNSMLDQTTDMDKKMAVIDKMYDAMNGMVTYIKQMSGKMDGVANKMDHMDSTVANVGNKMDGMATDVSGVSTKMDQMNSTVANVGNKMDGMATNVSTVATKMDQMNSTVANVGNKMDGMATNVSTVATKMDQMNSTVANVGNKMDQMNSTVANVGNKMDGMAADVSGVSTKMDQMNSTVANVGNKMDGMASNVSGVSTKMDQMNSTVTNVGNKMDGMANNVSDVATKMDQMNSTVNNIGNKMEGMSANVSSVSTKMDTIDHHITVMTNLMVQMNSTLILTHSDLGVIFTGQHRIESLAAMDGASDLATKVGYAAEYMISQTYQSWNSTIDSPERRLDLMAIAVPDFFFKISNYIQNRNDASPTKTSNQTENLYAISATIDYINMIEMDGLKGSTAQPVTMLSMIEDGLRQQKDVISGKVKLTDLPVYQQKVLENAADAIYLLRVRQNFLKGIAFTLASNQSSGNAQSKFGTIWDAFRAIVLKSSVSVDVPNGVPAIDLIATTLDSAAETEKFLIDMKVDPMNYKTLSSLLEKLDLGADAQLVSSDEYNHLSKALNTVIQLDRQN